ncbi:MAG: GNAT family N-acetyltransferase [Litoreibacter sp.]|uniref:GNAT family N-acetyltransferase n=1 Tax=Litoreibacter sp. TaxID=1969459 RepID=UPI003297CED8
MNATFKAPEDYDAAVLLDLIREAFVEQNGRIDPPSSMNTLRISDIETHLANEMIFVIEEGGTPAACLFGTRKQGALYVGKLSVRLAARGSGHAKRLIAAAEIEAFAMGLRYLTLIVRRELTENHAFFQHLGFEKFAEARHDGYDTVTEFHFRKVLL